MNVVVQFRDEEIGWAEQTYEGARFEIDQGGVLKVLGHSGSICAFAPGAWLWVEQR